MKVSDLQNINDLDVRGPRWQLGKPAWQNKKGGLGIGRPYLSTDTAYQSGGVSQEISVGPSPTPSTQLHDVSARSGLGEGLAEAGEHAVAGDVAEGRQLQRVVAAMKREGAGICVVAA